MTTSESRAEAPGEPPASLPASRELGVAGLRPVVPRVLAVMALLAWVSARGIAPALPGSSAGLARWIALGDRVAALLSQLVVLIGSLVAFRLIVGTLREHRLGVVYRLAAVPIGAGVLTLIMASASREQDAPLLFLLAVASALLALAAAPLALADARSRALGLTLALAGLAAFLHVFSRAIAIHASSQALASLYRTSRVVATVALGADVVMLVVVAAWLVAPRRLRGAAVLGAGLALAALIVWGAARGSGLDAPLWEVIAARSLSDLARAPAPLVATWVSAFLELAVMVVALGAVLFPGRVAAVGAAMALALLARSSADVPALALCLLVAAMMGALLSGEEGRLRGRGDRDRLDPARPNLAPEKRPG
ncbi:MAG: hypothetical protein OZ921_13990 [Sorangiineae bacterium]|nr:hypothetical protein [Polyangiaceae bacterium]MEB2323619.1 hypothetical protein [Sorangiineae bacterium]